MRAAWEYAYLHGTSTIAKPHNFQAPGPQVFVFETLEGPQIIQGVDSPLGAFNRLGADGWIVQVPEAWRPNNAPVWIKSLVDATLDEFTVFQSWTYLARRPFETRSD
jgi:hypothetical protein